VKQDRLNFGCLGNVSDERLPSVWLSSYPSERY
jgi:hypothetical protein